MANIENLIPKDSNQSREEAKKNGRKGGKASGIARRKRKTMREQMEMLMSLPLSPNQNKLKEQIKQLGIPEDDINMQMAMIVSMFQQGVKGNTKAFELIRDSLGEKPIEQVQNLNPPVINIERPK